MLQLQPTSERLFSLDALRGFALLGVLITNVFIFNIANGNFNDYFNQFSDSLNHSAITVIRNLFRGRFYPIFAFLFGLGIGLQFLKNKDNQLHYQILFCRMAILLLIGVIHYIFVWEGDILVKYALVGFLAILIAPLKNSVILSIAIGIYIIHSIYSFSIYNAGDILSIPRTEIHTFFPTHASYWDLVTFRSQHFMHNHLNVTNIFYTIKIMSFIMLGLYFGKRYTFKNESRNMKHWYKYLFILLNIRILTAFLSYIISNESATVILSFLNYAVNPALYIFGFLIIINLKPTRWIQYPLAYVGKMSLTNYLLQTTILSTIFYGYGFAKFQVWPPYIYFVIALIIFAVQIILSFLWFKNFSQGPIERIWRVATHSWAKNMS